LHGNSYVQPNDKVQNFLKNAKNDKNAKKNLKKSTKVQKKALRRQLLVQKRKTAKVPNRKVQKFKKCKICK